MSRCLPSPLHACKYVNSIARQVITLNVDRSDAVAVLRPAALADGAAGEDRPEDGHHEEQP